MQQNATIKLKEFNSFQYKREAILKRKPVKGPMGQMGIPMGLNIYETYHFWHPLLTELGYEIVRSPLGSRELYLAGQSTIPSDTICYPAKLMHGHMEFFLENKINKVFYPCMPRSEERRVGKEC